VLKKKIFLPQHNVRGPDPFYERLIYLQAEDDTIIQGHIPMDDEERVVALAGMSMAVAYGDELGYSVEDLVNAKVVDFIMPDWRAKKSAPEWAKMILEMRDTLVASDPEDLQESFLQIIQASPFYGTHWFYVTKADAASTAAMPQSAKNLPSDIMLGFNQDGLTVCDTKHKPQITFAYADIVKWTGATGTFTLTLNEPSLPDPFEFPLHTAQGSDIAAIILDHIKAVMVEQEIHLVGESGIEAK
jgi:hypothetical protein